MNQQTATPESPNAPLRYHRRGAGKALVLVHGYYGGADVWQRQLAVLGGDYDVIAIEHKGYGNSADLPACDSIDGFATQILALLDTLNVESFYLLGHSMGGMIAQQITANAPTRVEKLICYGTGPRGAMPNRFESIETSRQRLLSDGAAATGRRIAATWFVRDSDAENYPATAAIAEQLSLSAALAGLDAMEQWDGCEQLAHIKQPTLVLWGDRDQSYQWQQPETLWREINNSSLAVMPNCGHNAHLENPELFNLLVRDFLNASF